MKTKLKFYNRVYKEIKKGLLRIYFFIEIKLLKFSILTLKIKREKKQNFFTVLLKPFKKI